MSAYVCGKADRPAWDVGELKISPNSPGEKRDRVCSGRLC